MGASLEMAAPESFVEPAAPGWLAVTFIPEAAALGSGNGAWTGVRYSGTKMELDSGDGLIDGLQIISSDSQNILLGGIDLG
jgi:hypothetical protein